MWTILTLSPDDHSCNFPKEHSMEITDKIVRRLALFEGIDFPPADLEAIAAEIADLDRIVAELEEFGRGTPWMSQQTQPAGKKD
jgi:hypothetical protein